MKVFKPRADLKHFAEGQDVSARQFALSEWTIDDPRGCWVSEKKYLETSNEDECRKHLTTQMFSYIKTIVCGWSENFLLFFLKLPLSIGAQLIFLGLGLPQKSAGDRFLCVLITNLHKIFTCVKQLHKYLLYNL